MKKALLLALCLFAAFVTPAQSKLVFEETLPEAYLIKYSTTGSSSQININSIVSLLAGKVVTDQGGRSNRRPEFVISFEQEARLAKEGNAYQAKVQLTKADVKGDIVFKGFDIGKVLLPERLNYTVKLLNAEKKEVKSWSQSADFGKSRMLLLEALLPDTAVGPGFSLKVESKELVYTSESVKRVQQHLDLVRDYYTADVAVATVLAEVTGISPDDVDRIPQQDRSLRQAEEAFERLKKAPYREKLNLKQYDPQKLLIKMAQLEQLLQDRRRAINHALANLDLLFFNKGMALLSRGDASGAQAYFGKSIEANPVFAPSHLQLAHLDFRNGYLKEAAIRTGDVLTRMRVDPQTAQLTLALAHDIYTTFITSGNNLTSRGDYRNALLAYHDARSLCSTIGGLRCNMPALNDGEGRAAHGAYRVLVDDGKKFLARNDLANADRAANEAQEFQRQYAHALEGAHAADDLQLQVKQKYYEQHIAQGRLHLKEKNHSAALSQFEAALDLEKTYAFQPIMELKALAQDAAKPVMLEQLRQGYTLAMGNKLADARAVASTVQTMQGRYALGQDKDIQDRYRQLQDRLVLQECMNTQAAFDTHFQKASELAREKKYIAADQAYQAAIEATEGKQNCNIATFTATDGRVAIANAVVYQQMLEAINRLVASGRYPEAIQKYSEAEKHYLTHEVIRFGLDHLPLFSFARDNSRLAFSAAVVSHYANLQQEKEAVQLLFSLLAKGYSKGKTKRVQQQLGRQLATKDTALHLTDNPKALATRYTNGDKKLKQLAKAYEKEKKRLAKG